MARQSRSAQSAEARKSRIKFGDPRLRMSVDHATMEKFKKEGLVPRWVNDQKNRINELKLRGYEFVRDPDKEIQAGEDAGNTDLGSSVSKIVGKDANGAPIRSYLMVQQKEFYDEDQEAKEAINKKVDEAIRRGEPGGPNATAVRESGGRTYVKNVEYRP